ncbi:hypothetical protein B0H19DRAFT_1067158 [Mycena capillaripes]|nr:hypothetical protein B0H19DRAFT_1067158 [Mycena capillaripes]
MLVVFTRFGTLFRITFSSLWSTARFLFGSERPGSDDIEMGTDNKKRASFNVQPDSPLEINSFADLPAISSVRFAPHYSSEFPEFSPFGLTRDGERRTVACDGAQCEDKIGRESSIRTICVPLGNVTNIRAHANGLIAPFAAIDSFPERPSVPGSMGWQSDKLKLLGEAHAWNTRVKSISDDRRRSLPLPAHSTSEAPLANVRRASAPANLGHTGLSLEEHLHREVSGPWKPATADRVTEEPQFVIGEDEGDDNFEENTYVADISTSDTKVAGVNIFHPVSELPYLKPLSSSLSANSLSSCGSEVTLTDVIDALEAMFTSSKWLSLVDLESAAAREEAHLRSVACSVA